MCIGCCWVWVESDPSQCQWYVVLRYALLSSFLPPIPPQCVEAGDGLCVDGMDAGLKEGVTDVGLQSIAEAGCGSKLTTLTLLGTEVKSRCRWRCLILHVHCPRDECGSSVL